MASVSAYILSYNRPLFLVRAINSILSQSRFPDEIIIFDNASDFDLNSLIIPYANFNIKIIGSDKNNGPEWNFSRAIAYSSSDYVFILHDDDYLYQDYISVNLSYMELHPDVVLSSCNGTLVDNNDVVLGNLFLFHHL